LIRRVCSAVPIWRAADGAAKIGSPPVLLTHALADFLRAHRLTYRRLGLPICARAPMRLKRGLGIDKLGERRARWSAAQSDRLSRDPARREAVARLLGVSDVTTKRMRRRRGG